MSDNSLTQKFLSHKEKAEKGDKVAQCNLGYCYEIGQGTEINLEQAAFWYGKSASQGYLQASYNLGLLYYNGKGVKKNYQKAVERFTFSAKKEHAKSQFMLGLCFYNGYGVEKNPALAVSYYEKAANKGDPSAQNNLGVCYKNGNGVAKNLEKAVFWYEKSANQGNINAQNNLANCYRYGDGVNKDYKMAKFWYEKPAEKGNETAITALKEMSAEKAKKIKAEKKAKRLSPVSIISIIWILLSISFLTYCWLTDLSYLRQLPLLRTDFVKYIFWGGVAHAFLFLESLFGVSLIFVLPEFIKKKKSKHPILKAIIIGLATVTITLFAYLLKEDFTLKTHGVKMLVTFLIEILVLIFLFGLVFDDFYLSTKDFLLSWCLPFFLFPFFSIFLFLLCSHLKAIGRTGLSILAGIPIVIVLSMPLWFILIPILEKATGGDSYAPSSSSSSRNTGSSNKYYHYKTTIESCSIGGEYETAILGRKVQDYDVEITFHFKNSAGKEKTKKAYTTVTDSPGILSTTPMSISEAEERFKYMLDPID